MLKVMEPTSKETRIFIVVRADINGSRREEI